MEPTTLRLPEDLVADLTEEADDFGYSSRSEYIRHILRNRTNSDPNTPRNRNGAGSNTTVDALVDRVDSLETRVQALEDDTGSSTSVEMGETTETTSTESEDDDRLIPDVTSYDGDIDVIDEVIEGWCPGLEAGEKREQQRTAGRAALEYLRSSGTATAPEFRADVEPEHQVDGQSPDTWWEKTARPALERARDQEVVVFNEGANEWRWHRH
jgi:Arc/MetJ-type ribon-helix-helix transcriptional regulator